MLNSLSTNTTLVGAAGTIGGSPYILVNLASLAPGATTTVTLTFTVPAAGGIT